MWLGPKTLTEFANETDFQRRYEIIQQNRGEGSITPNVMETLLNASNIDIYPETYIRTSLRRLHKNYRLKTTQGIITNVSRVILATGYRFNLRRYKFLAELIRQHQVPLVRWVPTS